MTGELGKLPEFNRPPVVEVAISIQFAEITQLQTAHFGLLWERYRDRYPLTEHQPPLARQSERLERSVTGPPRITVEQTVPVPRCWFLNPEGTRLIQVQRDRFVLNWRKQDLDISYPRYRTIRSDFLRELGEFSEFIEEESLGEIAPDQCELTYVNHVIRGNGWNRLSDVPDVLRVCGRADDPEPGSVEHSVQYLMPDGETPVGRLYVALDTPIHRQTGDTILRLRLIARGAPQGDGIEGALAFLDSGHEWIVNTFADVTTTKMHELWERTQ